MCLNPQGSLHELDVLYVPDVVNKLSYCVITLGSCV